MRSRLCVVLLGAMVWSGVVAGAQTITFPVKVPIAWVPSPSVGNVYSYIVRLNGAQVGAVAPSSCAALCTSDVILKAPGTYTVDIRAVNFFGSSVPSTLTFSTDPPLPPGTVIIVIPAQP